MTPEEFRDAVARPNMVAALNDPGDVRAIVNAVLSLDALAGIIHAHGKASGTAGIADHKTDDKYRDMLAGISHSYRVLRDAAAALKHGILDQGRKARLLTGPDAVQAVPNVLGLFQLGDRLGGDVVLIEYQPDPCQADPCQADPCQPGPKYIRASTVVADSFRMLDRIVKGEPPQIDEYDERPKAPCG